jgi:serine/threonine-protein kinase
MVATATPVAFVPASPASAEPAPGQVLAGKYRVERILGRGAMGIVVAARHLQLDQVVAIKLLVRDAVDDEVAVERFLREARSAAKLRSDHVARVLDVGKLPGGAPYMVMELLEGADLADVLETRGQLEAALACEYVVQACDAVAEAHMRGIVHRDLKPENLYLTTRVGGERMVKVLDFGISKVMTGKQGALTQTRAVVGSPLYMAPEQLRSSKDASPRSDVWALGVVLYELLTRRWPFEADSLPDLCVKVAREAPRPVTALREDVPAALAAVIDRCLRKDPAERYADAGALAAALEPFVEPALRDVIERSRRTARTLAETGAAPLDAPSRAGGLRPGTWLGLGAALAVVAVVAVAVATAARGPGGAPASSLAAVEGALQGSDLAGPAAMLSPSGLDAPWSMPSMAPVQSALRAPAVPALVHTLRPAHRPLLANAPKAPAAPAPPVPPAPADDIPAFR